ncbi:PAS domain-containing sensor histidine kinase [Flavobacterium humi]|nr:PAS domain S-box protein [Flavobacterium humi]
MKTESKDMIQDQEKDSDARSLLLEGLPIAVFTCNCEGLLTYYNAIAEGLWVHTPVIQKDPWFGSWKFYKEDGSSMSRNEFTTVKTLNDRMAAASGKVIIERADGVLIPVLPFSKPVFDKESGKMTGVLNLLVPVGESTETDLKIADNEMEFSDLSGFLDEKVEERTLLLKKSEERYHKMIEEVEDYAILLLDRDGNILNWNKGAEKIKGYSEKEILGNNFRLFYLEEDRMKKLPEQLITQAAETGKAMHEGWRRKKNGDRFWGQIVITALHDQENNIIGFTKVTRDLTERKLAEDQARKLTQDIELRNTQLEEYAHIASHDLQEPLRKILTFAGLLKRNPDDKEATLRNIEKINSSAEKMLKLIKDIMQYSQLLLTDELFEMNDLNTVLENVKDDYELLIEEKKAEINCSGLPVVRGIPIQLHQLFYNLLGNSLKFSGENPVITIISEKAEREEIQRYPQLESNTSYVKITFKDNGIGFDPLYADKIFKLFERLHTETPGTGIGLALCKKIIENHKGHIQVSSELGVGTVFTLFLPG